MMPNRAIKSDFVDVLPDSEEVCFVIKNLFCKVECENLLRQAETAGFRSANDKYPESYRNNERLQVDDASLASKLFERARSHMPSKLETEDKSYALSRLNERLRYCKYSTGQSFSIHQDGIHYPNTEEESVLTFLLYLNDSSDYEGGETAFYKDKPGNIKVAEYSAEAGDVIVFDHMLWHSGQPVVNGNKYILRSDFIYRVIERKGLRQPHHNGYIWKLINLTGNRIASASRDKSIKIWNESMVLEQTLISHDNSVFDIACSADALFSVSRDGFLSVWRNGASGYELKDKVDTYHQSVLSVAVCDEFVVTCGADGHVNKWNSAGEPVSRKRVTEGWVWKVLPVSQNRILICTSKGEVKTIDQSDLGTLSEQQLDSAIRCAAFDGQSIYVGDENGRVYQLDAMSLAVLGYWSAHIGIVRDVEVRSSEIISCGEDGKVMSLDLDSEVLKEIHSGKNFVTSLCMFGDRLLSSSYTGRIEIHEP